MKYILSLLIFSVFVTFSFSAKASLTPTQEQFVIQTLNDYCADSWCESATEFNFKNLTCDDQSSTCELTFTTQDNSTPNTPIYDQVCEIQPYTQFEQMVYIRDNSESGQSIDGLKDSFVEQVDRCAEHYFH